MKTEAGFTLIEIIASLVIVGIIATFSSLFLTLGLEGYEFTRNTADAALKAEMALNRLSLELRSLNSILAAPVTDTSLSYTSSDASLTGNRAIKFAGTILYITSGGTDYKLLDEITSPTLAVTLADLDNDTLADDVAYIDVGFSIRNLPAFNVRVYPREMVAKTW